jgi:hypothetical protein
VILPIFKIPNWVRITQAFFVNRLLKPVEIGVLAFPIRCGRDGAVVGFSIG